MEYFSYWKRRREIDEFDMVRISFARNHYMTKAKAELAKENRSSKEGRAKAIEKAIEIMNSGAKYLKDDHEAQSYINGLKEELDSL